MFLSKSLGVIIFRMSLGVSKSLGVYKRYRPRGVCKDPALVSSGPNSDLCMCTRVYIIRQFVG